MSNLVNYSLECKHISEDREKYNVIINDEKKTLTLCKNCVEYFKSFHTINFLSDIEAIPQ